MSKEVKGYRGVADNLIVKARSGAKPKIHKERYHLWII